MSKHSRMQLAFGIIHEPDPETKKNTETGAIPGHGRYDSGSLLAFWQSGAMPGPTRT
jgi:hypothetical protein